MRQVEAWIEELGDKAGESLCGFPALLLHLGKVLVQDMAAGLAEEMGSEHSIVEFLRDKPCFR